jgi:hypothetical protein
MYRLAPVSTRGLPIRFEEVSRVQKPSRKAKPEAWQAYREAIKHHNLSRRFVETMGQLRLELDLAGGEKKILVLAVDGSFCNRTCLRAPRDRTELIARARKDAVLCARAAEGSRRFYNTEKFTPEQVRQDAAQPWKQTKVFYGGKWRKVRYKEVAPVYWQGGAGRCPLRLLVVAPTPYRKRKSRKLYYRKPAFLLTTDLQDSVKQLLQIYFDRWQIEVNHRDEKDTLGVGQAQLWNVKAVPKQPVLAVAAYSALLLASLIAFGATRGAAYAALPKWRRKAYRPSCLDLACLSQLTSVFGHLGVVSSRNCLRCNDGISPPCVGQTYPLFNGRKLCHSAHSDASENAPAKQRRQGASLFQRGREPAPAHREDHSAPRALPGRDQ